VGGLPGTGTGTGAGTQSPSSPSGATAFTTSSQAYALARRVRATRTRFSSRGPAAKRGTVLRFRLRKPGTIEIVIRSANCSVLGRKRVHAHRGLNRVRFTGRLHGRPLAPGRYSLGIAVIRGSSRKLLGAIGVEVVPPGLHLTKAQRSAPLGTACYASLTVFPPLPVAVVSTAAPAVGAGSSKDSSKPAGAVAVKANSPRTGVLGVSLKPPHLLVTPGGAPEWLGVLLIVVFGFALVALVAYATRFIRGSVHL
jgi:hypothetical protein